MRIGVSVSAALAALALVALPSGPGHAQSKGKSIQTEADWVAYDADAQQITVKVLKTGKGKDASLIKRGKEAVFQVKAEGTVLSKTVVKVNGKAGELTDIPAGKRVLIYWQAKEGKPFARSIDVVFSEEELNERYPDRDS